MLTALRQRCVMPAQMLRAQYSLPVCRIPHLSRSFASQTINVPPMGDSISEGTVAELLTPTGHSVKVDDIVARLDTDKVSVDIRSTHSGKITKWYAKAGETVKVGKPLLDVEIGAAGEAHPVREMGSVQVPAAKPNADVGEKRPAPLAESGTISPQSIYPTDPVDTVLHRKPLIHFRYGKRDPNASQHHPGHPSKGPAAQQVLSALTGNFADENEAAANAWAALPERYKRTPLKQAQLDLIELGGAPNYEPKKKVRAA